MNLAVNARDAMPEGGTLRIETAQRRVDEAFARRTRRAPGELRALSVSDTGVGMDERRDAAHVRAVLHDQGAGQGHRARPGDGATASSSRAAAHITVESEPGAGTTFSVFLPRADAAGASRSPQPRRGARPRGTETVLLVEDEALVREIAKRAADRPGLPGARGRARRGGARRRRQRTAPRFTSCSPTWSCRRWAGASWASSCVEVRPAIRVLYMSGYTAASHRRAGRGRSRGLRSCASRSRWPRCSARCVRCSTRCAHPHPARRPWPTGSRRSGPSDAPLDVRKKAR